VAARRDDGEVAGRVQRAGELRERERAPGVTGGQRVRVGGQVFVEVAQGDAARGLDRRYGSGPGGLAQVRDGGHGRAADPGTAFLPVRGPARGLRAGH
jgi:hypothetical protein